MSVVKFLGVGFGLDFLREVEGSGIVGEMNGTQPNMPPGAQRGRMIVVCDMHFGTLSHSSQIPTITSVPVVSLNG